MSLAYKAHLEECEKEGVEPATVEEFTRCRSGEFPSLTVQSDAESCDINRIVAQFDRTGLVTHLAKGMPEFIDVSELTDFRETVDAVSRMRDWFMQLPAALRAEFSNDPAEMLDRISDPSWDARLQELGIKKKAEGAGAPSA